MFPDSIITDKLLNIMIEECESLSMDDYLAWEYRRELWDKAHALRNMKLCLERARSWELHCRQRPVLSN